jgi:integrase
VATVTAKEITQWCKRRGTYPCGDNLYLQVSVPGRASWLFRFMQHKRPHGIGLGSVKNWTLAQARERAKEQRQFLDDGVNPLEHRRAARAAKPVVMTFDECAKLYWTAHRAEWTSKHHAAGWLASITRIASPVIGNMDVSKIALADVLAVLEPEWVAHYPTMSRLRGRLELILGYAAAHGWRDANNPATWDILKHLLPTIKHEKKQRAAMAYSDVPKLMGELRARPDVEAAALRMLILTACRPGEVRGARWSEIDGSLWTIPAQRMKARKVHVVMLSPAAVEPISKSAHHRRHQPD